MKHFLVVASLMFFALQTTAQEWRLLCPYVAFTMVVNPQDPLKLYVGSWASQMYRSDDGGKSWEVVISGPTGGYNAVSSLMVSRHDTSVIINGGFRVDGIRRSTNSGEEWSQRISNTFSGNRWFISDAIIEDVANPRILYAARGAVNNIVFRSTDVGETWDSISAVPMAITSRLCTITQRPDSSNIMFLGCLGGVILRSTDSGFNWSRVPVLRGRLGINTAAEIPKIVFSPRDPLTGYAVVAITNHEAIADNGGILKTVDGGQTWDRIAMSDTSFWSIEVRPGPDNNDDLVAGGFRTTTIPTLVVGDSLVFHSTNGGNSWTRYENIPWGESELGDTVRNVWMLRYDSRLKKMYMATTMGLFQLDESTSVNESVVQDASPTLIVKVDNDQLVVRDLKPTSDAITWTLYTMQAAQIASGKVLQPQEHHISLANITSGRYLLVWGTDRAFRTAQVIYVR